MQSWGYTCRGGHLTTPLSIFPLYLDTKRLMTFCRQRNGWRWLHLGCFFLCPDYLLKDSCFHMFAKHMTRALPMVWLPWINSPPLENVCMESWGQMPSSRRMRRDGWCGKWGVLPGSYKTSLAPFSYFAKMSQVFYIYCDLTLQYRENMRFICSIQSHQELAQQENVVGILPVSLILSVV